MFSGDHLVHIFPLRAKGPSFLHQEKKIFLSGQRCCDNYLTVEDKLELPCFEHLLCAKLSALDVYFPPENVNSLKAGTLPDPYTRM